MSEHDYEELNGSQAAPVGEETYRKRRIAAAIVAILAILLLIWGLTWLFGKIMGGSSDENAAGAASTSASSEPFDSFSARPSESDEATDKATDEAEASESADAEATAEPSNSDEATVEATETAEPTAKATVEETVEPTVEATPTPTETVAVAQACSAANMNVVLTPSQTTYTAGQNPSMALTYTNTSANPCEIPAAAQAAVINITSGPAQVYNTATCNLSPATVAELEAGQVGQAAFTWDRTLNSLGCNNLRNVQPGHYWATATVNGVTSQPARIIIAG
ncbi:hypothetical protein [Rothia sp. ZJ932]|uniref:hypothetical protein n=1 Tax=Rothia sp. ZJ932 TaxID=2810516 RepID=UPI001967BEB4|nr:hypothetical protein [Rothia sp. ZJ932]QRZ61768.1 hypothetical protein JR346_01090 [Rothia sp. ZJ932]